MRLVACLAVACVTAFAQDHVEDSTNPFAGNQQAVTAGARLYAQTCQSCHGAAGAGERGPALNGRLARGERDGEIFQNIRNGVPGTAMPAFGALSTDETWQLVVFIRSLTPAITGGAGGGGSVAAGSQIFAGKGGCVGCHAVNGRGGITGPDLSVIGATAADALRQKILTPSAEVAADAVAARFGKGAVGPASLVRIRRG
jgi:mono/diheme cytochrome c family protein